MLRIIVQEQQADGTWKQTEQQECEGCYILSMNGDKLDEYMIDVEITDLVDMMMQAGIVRDLIEPLTALKRLDEKISQHNARDAESADDNVDEMIKKCYGQGDYGPLL